MVSLVFTSLASVGMAGALGSRRGGGASLSIAHPSVGRASSRFDGSG
jgi:hypothetical protein